MTKDERFNEFWAKYKAFNRNGKVKARESYFKAEERWLKRNPGKTADDFPNYLLRQLHLDEQQRDAKRKVPHEFVPPWPMGATYLNQERFEDEFEESISDIEERERSPYQCARCDKNDYLYYLVGFGHLCSEHFKEAYNQIRPDVIEAMRENIKQIQRKFPKREGESWYEFHSRYVDHLKKHHRPVRLPYRKGDRLADEPDYDEKEVMREIEGREFKGVDEETLKRYYGAGG